jgi:ADP-ribose pyrophosphatase YjhB (NUDIX family)
MIRFDRGPRRFNYRIAGVAIDDGAVLVHRAEHEPYWTLPGGRAEHGETAEDTIRREMREELETDVDVVRLLWLVENFFHLNGLHYHEVALYFLMRFPPNSLPLASRTFERREAGGAPFMFMWHPLQRDALRELPLYPAFLPQGLTELPRSVVHIVERHDIPAASSANR